MVNFSRSSDPMEDNGELSHSQRSFMPLFPRLNHLDFVMKYLERKQKLSKLGISHSDGGMERQCIPLDIALKDTYFKGSLLDRVAALEHRLFQLCLEMDSGSSSNPSSTQTSAEIISSSPKQFSRGDPSSSYPTFRHGSSQISQVQEKPERQQRKNKQRSSSKPQVGKTKTRKDEGSCKNVKKEIPHKWPHLRMFGC